MANSVVMLQPSGFSGSVITTQSTPPGSGQKYTPDSNGYVLVDPRDVSIMQTAGFTVIPGGRSAVIGTADNGTTQTLTAAMIASAVPATMVAHVSTGGATPTLTLPLATAMDTLLTMMAVGDSYVLRVINSNSGTATVATNTGWTTSGTLTLATNTWRDFVVKKTAAGAYSLTSIGTGANS